MNEQLNNLVGVEVRLICNKRSNFDGILLRKPHSNIFYVGGEDFHAEFILNGIDKIMGSVIEIRNLY